MNIFANEAQTTNRLFRSQLFAALLFALAFAQPLSAQNEQIVRVKKNDHGESIILWNGRPCFRAGYYMPAHYSAAQLMDMTEWHSEAAFNHMHAKRLQMSSDDFQQFLMKAEKSRIGVAYSIGMSLDAVDAFKNSPAIVSWYVDDVQNYEPSALSKHAKRVRELDPTRVIDFSGGWRTDLRRVLPATDVYHRQFYPIRKTGDGRNHLRMTEAYQEAKKVVNLSKQFGTVPCMDLQGAYSDSGAEYWPTAEETDVMFYMVVTAGVKGVRWCDFGDLQDAPVRKQSRLLVSELNSGLDKVFLLGERTDHKISNGIVYGIWEYDGDVYIVAVNATEKFSPKFSIPSPPCAEGPSSLFEHRASNLRCTTDQGLQGRLPPFSVEIYRGARDDP